VDLLLDTNALLWWISNSSKLGDRARTAIIDPHNQIFVSSASAWEIAVKYSLGRLPLPDNPRAWLPEQLASNRFSPLPITLDHALAIHDLPRHHTDPFDRLLIAQALTEHLLLVTGDRVFDRYAVELIRCW
jgi:PIN domain nuclease of toxin-antitoxin system